MDLQEEPTGLGTVKQTIVETIEAPRLENFEVPDLVTFKEKRLVYERRVSQKNRDPSVNIPFTTYRDSVSESVLRMFVTARWIEADSVGNITEEQLKGCIERRARVDERDYNLANVERRLAKVTLERPRKGSTLETQVWRLCMKYYDTLKACGYDSFVESKPKIAVSHIYKRLSHTHLKNKVRMSMRLRKEELEKDFNLFMRTELKRPKQSTCTIRPAKTLPQLHRMVKETACQTPIAVARNRIERKGRNERGLGLA